ncbi:hypothetical protein HPB51_010923 [Rhipicephalus microplus]|uniref:DDE Tnp4 domain-containing protein n=1 Tax=Rhipicephalus microplus TaxID=6941 RepID=A0A9J6D512_RHIMP|nr:hypothetical protein HPB51_010923 [Rhipicephalus microplus]
MPAVSAVSCRNRTVLTSTLVLLMLLIKKRKQLREQRQPRRWWIRLVFLARKQEILYHTATPTKADWQCIAEGFNSRWQFRNCLGAVDGKHVAIVCPPKSGSEFFNYKGTFSIVLMAVVDSDCKYVLADVGAESHQSDGGIFKESSFGRDVSKGRLDIPAVGTLLGTSTSVAYAFVGDEAFQLHSVQKMPSYHCCQVGNTNSHHQPAPQPCGLRGESHNFLTLYHPHAHQFLDREDSFGNVVAGRWRRGVQHVPDNSFFAMAPTQARNYDGDTGAARRLFASYFSSMAGQVPWQWRLPGLTMKQPS